MRDGVLKRALTALVFSAGARRTIRLGPLRGMVFRVNAITGLAPWYSGAERDHQRVFAELVVAGDTVIDVGANWGLHTLYFSRLVGPRGLVVAAEPFPPVLAELEWHVAENRCANVRIAPVALSDEDGIARFQPGAAASTGHLEAGASPATVAALEVTTQTLDGLVDALGLRAIRLVKIDVEGAEGRVLRGAVRTLESQRPHLVIDLHTPEQDLEVAHLLTARNYTLRRVSGPPIRRTDAGWPARDGVWGSILARPGR